MCGKRRVECSVCLLFTVAALSIPILSGCNAEDESNEADAAYERGFDHGAAYGERRLMERSTEISVDLAEREAVANRKKSWILKVTRDGATVELPYEWTDRSPHKKLRVVEMGGKTIYSWSGVIDEDYGSTLEVISIDGRQFSFSRGTHFVEECIPCEVIESKFRVPPEPIGDGMCGAAVEQVY